MTSLIQHAIAFPIGALFGFRLGYKLGIAIGKTLQRNRNPSIIENEGPRNPAVIEVDKPRNPDVVEYDTDTLETPKKKKAHRGCRGGSKGKGRKRRVVTRKMMEGIK